MEQHHPIIDKLGDFGGRTYRQTNMDDETWAKVVKVVAPGIRKMAVSNVVFVCSIYSLLI